MNPLKRWSRRLFSLSMFASLLTPRAEAERPRRKGGTRFQREATPSISLVIDMRDDTTVPINGCVEYIQPGGVYKDLETELHGLISENDITIDPSKKDLVVLVCDDAGFSTCQLALGVLGGVR